MVEKIGHAITELFSVVSDCITKLFGSAGNWFVDSSGDLNILGIAFAVGLIFFVVGFVFNFVRFLIRR